MPRSGEASPISSVYEQYASMFIKSAMGGTRFATDELKKEVRGFTAARN